MNDHIHHVSPRSPWCLHKALFRLVTVPAHTEEVVVIHVTATAEQRPGGNCFYNAHPLFGPALYVATVSKQSRLHKIMSFWYWVILRSSLIPPFTQYRVLGGFFGGTWV